jgi:hypothetical protein
MAGEDIRASPVKSPKAKPKYLIFMVLTPFTQETWVGRIFPSSLLG